jgi:hypothetical protein
MGLFIMLLYYLIFMTSNSSILILFIMLCIIEFLNFHNLCYLLSHHITPLMFNYRSHSFHSLPIIMMVYLFMLYPVIFIFNLKFFWYLNPLFLCNKILFIALFSLLFNLKMYLSSTHIIEKEYILKGKHFLLKLI